MENVKSRKKKRVEMNHAKCLKIRKSFEKQKPKIITKIQ